MGHHHAVLVFIPMLAAATCATEEPDMIIGVRSARIGAVGLLVAIEKNAYRDSGRVNPTAPFRGWYPLNSVTPSLIDEFGDVLRRDGDASVHHLDGMQSMTGVEVTRVGVGEIADKQLGIGTALGGSDFNFHVILL